MLKLIVGLGNPGLEYANTRHNAGFWFIDQLAAKLNVALSNDGKYLAQIAKITLNGESLWLMKPLTYMNRAGQAVQALTTFYKIKAAEILIVHDELDFTPGTIKLKHGGGNGGHNGLRDIDRVMGNEYWRLRIGIGHPGVASKVHSYVLHGPTTAEYSDIQASLSKALAISQQLIAGDFAMAQKTLHTKG